MLLSMIVRMKERGGGRGGDGQIKSIGRGWRMGVRREKVVRDLWLGADVVMTDADMEALVGMMGEIVDGMVGENVSIGSPCADQE